MRATYERGRYLQAWRAAAPLGPLPGWPGADGLVLAGRLANQLGNERLGALLHLKARRLHPESGEAWLWAARVACERLGPWRGRELLARGGPPGTAPEELLALRGRLAAEVRDFDEAERLLAEAVALAPDDAWTALQPGLVQSRADDHQAALETAERALALQPWYRPAVDFRAQCLLALGRDDEAATWLEEALGHLEAASTCEVLLQLQLDRGEHRGAEATLQRLEALTPLRSRAYEGWLEARRSDVAYHLGDRARAAAHARRSRSPFYLALADRLEAEGGASRRVVLPVPFVRQHHLTCAPATLSAVCALHGVEATHLGIAEAICYDGTPEHAERRWARERGFTAREFTVTWDAAVSLLDRGLPFTLSMVEPGNSHLVAVAGYDEARGVLLLRDPSWRTLTEITRGWLDDHRASGPRGMALAPAGKAHLLEGLDLPEAA
ncbi:MAG: C39 family peptidase, partial [Anaeromyxobacteraceae bacterium]|nr:C39 family peptidase [Anaeromyxobacteraceae bacterium]